MAQRQNEKRTKVMSRAQQTETNAKLTKLGNNRTVTHETWYND